MCFFNDNRDNADNGLSATRNEPGCRKRAPCPSGRDLVNLIEMGQGALQVSPLSHKFQGQSPVLLVLASAAGKQMLTGVRSLAIW